MYGGREALPDDHKFRGQRGRVRARYRCPQLGRGTEKTGETSQRKTTCNSPPGHFPVKLRRSRRQAIARRKLHRAVDAQAATANSIPWSSTAKFPETAFSLLQTPHKSRWGRLSRLRPRISDRPTRPEEFFSHLDAPGIIQGQYGDGGPSAGC
jgi:hypothetical protein